MNRTFIKKEETIEVPNMPFTRAILRSAIALIKFCALISTDVNTAMETPTGTNTFRLLVSFVEIALTLTLNKGSPNV